MTERDWAWDKSDSMIPVSQRTKTMVEEILRVVDRIEEKISGTEKIEPEPEPEPTVEINKKVFDRLKELYNYNLWTRSDLEEWRSLIHLVFHTHDSEGDK